MRLCLLLALAALASGVYLPGVIPHDYLTNENVDLYVRAPSLAVLRVRASSRCAPVAA